MSGEEAICILFYAIFCSSLCLYSPENNKSKLFTSGIEPEPAPNKFKNNEHVTVNQLFQK